MKEGCANLQREKKNPTEKKRIEKKPNPNHFSCNESGPYTVAQDRSYSTAPEYNSLPLLDGSGEPRMSLPKTVFGWK